MSRNGAQTPTTTRVFDQLAMKLRQMARDVHLNDGSGVERFKVKLLEPFTIGELNGELSLEDGDPDFTIGETLRARIAQTPAVVAVDDLVWVARQDQEFHAFDIVSR